MSVDEAEPTLYIGQRAIKLSLTNSERGIAIAWNTALQNVPTFYEIMTCY